MEKNENQNTRQTELMNDSYVMISHEDSIKNENMDIENNKVAYINTSFENFSDKITKFLNFDKESVYLIKYLYKIKKHMMNFLGNLKQDLEFYTIIRDNIDSVITKIEEILLFYNKFFLSLKSIKFGFVTQEESNKIITCYLKLGELLNFIFEIYSNNIFLKLSILFFDKIHKSFLNLKSNKAKKIISGLLYENMVRFTDIIINKKIEFIDKFKDSKINYKLIKTINKVLDFIKTLSFEKNFISKNFENEINDFNLNSTTKTYNSFLEIFPNISEIFNYLLISRTNIFSLNAYHIFDDFSKIFYQIIKKLITIIIEFNISNEKFEEIKSVLNTNLFKLLEISRIKDDLKNSIEDSQHEFYLDSLNLYIKITKLIIKNFYTLEILADDNIKDKVCRFLIELSFWDSLDVVDNTCKFFLLIWKISEKHKIYMRSEIEKIIDFLFLRRFKLYYSLLNEQEDSLIKLSVLEILVTYLNILIRDYNFVFLIYLNYDFCKIRYNLLMEILTSCQKYFELTFPVYTHLKSNITSLYSNVFEILYDVIINGNFSKNGINKSSYYYPVDNEFILGSDNNKQEYLKVYSNKDNSNNKNENEKNINTCVIDKKENKNAKKLKNKHCVNKKIKNIFASDLEESEVEKNKNEVTSKLNKNKEKAYNIRSESSEIEEEDNDYDVVDQQPCSNFNNNDSESNEINHKKEDNCIKNNLETNITNKNFNVNLKNDLNEVRNKFNVDLNFIKEIQHLQDIWNDEILEIINSAGFKKFNNKVCPLFGLSPIETIHNKKGKKKEPKENLDTKESESKSNTNNSASYSSENNSSVNNEESNNSSFISDNSNSLNINIDIDPKLEKAESNNTFEIINSSVNNNSLLGENEEKILNNIDTTANIISNKNDEIQKLKELEEQKAKNYRKIAYAVAVMIKYSFYVDVEKLFEIFGNKNDLSRLIVEEYLNTFDFRGLDILKAYRIYVSTFKLTGESDIIYNMIMAFSEKYHKDNPNDSNLRSSDEVSTLAYSILMLNTDLHDPNIKEHMSIEDFTKNVYATRYFDHIQKSYLENIYKSILINPFKAPCKRNEDYTKTDELFEILKSKRNLVKNRKTFWENCKNKYFENLKIKLEQGNNKEENTKGNEDDLTKYLGQNYEGEVFLSDFNTENSERFLFEIFNNQNENNNNTLSKCFEVPKIKKSLNFSLYNLCENFNFNLENDNENNINNFEKNQNENKILSAVYYLLWEDIYYNFMQISSKFYEIRDENVGKIFDKICIISNALNKKDYIDKLIMQIHSLISSGKYEKKNLAQLYNIFFSISINYSKNFNSYLEIYFSSILDIIKHKIFKNESDLQENYKKIIEAQINKSFSVIDNKKNKRIQSTGNINNKFSIFGYLFTRNTKEVNEYGLNKYREHILNHLKINEALTPTNNFDEDFFEINRILEIIRNQDEEFIFFVSLAASKILDYNSKGEHYYSLVFLNEILNDNLNEKEFIKIWQNLFNIFVNKMEFKHIFDKEENLFEILFFNFFFNLIIRRFSHLIETDDYIQLLNIYSEVENFDILFYFMENNDLLHINENNILESDRKKLEDYFNDESSEREKSKNYKRRNNNKNNLLTNFNSRLIKKDTCLEFNILLIYKLSNYFCQNFQIQKSEINNLMKISETFKFLFRIISNINNFNDITIDTITYIHSIFKLLQEDNFVCSFISQKVGGFSDSFYRIVDSIIPRLLITLPAIDDQKWHFFLSILNTLANTLLIEEEKIQIKSFDCLKRLFEGIKIPAMILKEVLNILNSYFNGMRLCNYKHPKFWTDLFSIFHNIIKSNEEILNNENEMERLWHIYIKRFVDNYRQTNKINSPEKENIDYLTKAMLKETLNYVYNKVKTMDKSPNWWEANKNFIRLYFSDLIVFTN